MKAFEFTGKVTTEGRIELPDTILQKLAHNQQVKVIILILVNEPSQEEDKAWNHLAAEQLLKGYCEEDNIDDTI
ncbi:MAG: hypothetical protein HC908_00945 [Calothrix sp. SM1_7_51]|nr:hypothetical protein [Calothrix sp. SM1_7_51]